MLRVIDTETCGLQGGIVEIASVDIVDGQITNPMSRGLRRLFRTSMAARGTSRITPASIAGCCRRCTASGSVR